MEIKKISLNTTKEKKEYFNKLIREYSTNEISDAMQSLNKDTSKVLELHFEKGHSLQAISGIMNRSISVIRNHYNRGIFKLYKYFNPNSSENI